MAVDNANSTAPKKAASAWFKLDNAATIYPASRTRNWSNTYRMGLIMKEDIDPIMLQQAVDEVYPHAEYFFSHVSHGLFWDYLERTGNTKIVVEEDNYPCRPFDIFDSTRPALRIIYYKKRLCLEIFHGIADGYSGLMLIKTIAAKYLMLKGYDIPNNGEFLDLDGELTQEELADNYLKNYEPAEGATRTAKNAYQFKIKKIPNYFRIVQGIVPVSDLKELAGKRELTITDYLLTVYLYALYLNAPMPCKKEIKVSVPISLRPIFKAKSLRNFSLFTNIGFDPSEKENIDFDDIAYMIEGKLKEGIEKEEMIKAISLNVGAARTPLVRFMPIALKTQILKFAFKYVGQAKFTSSMTNLGIAKMPREMKEHVDRVEALLGGTPSKRISCAMISDGDTLTISFTGDNKNVNVQRDFFRFIAEQGARVRVECNCKESWDEK